jgi:uncharacterized protein YjiS (DUF1127 family)
MTIPSRFQGSGALAAPGGSLSGFGGALRRAALRAADLLLTWQERARQRRMLATLDDRMLDDIGIGHGEVLREADKPFWRG